MQSRPNPVAGRHTDQGSNSRAQLRRSRRMPNMHFPSSQSGCGVSWLSWLSAPSPITFAESLVVSCAAEDKHLSHISIHACTGASVQKVALEIAKVDIWDNQAKITKTGHNNCSETKATVCATTRSVAQCQSHQPLQHDFESCIHITRHQNAFFCWTEPQMLTWHDMCIQAGCPTPCHGSSRRTCAASHGCSPIPPSL